MNSRYSRKKCAGHILSTRWGKITYAIFTPLLTFTGTITAIVFDIFPMPNYIEKEMHNLSLEPPENSWRVHITSDKYTKSYGEDYNEDYVSVSNLSEATAKEVRVRISSSYIPVYMLCKPEGDFGYNDRLTLNVFEPWVDEIINTLTLEERERLVHDARVSYNYGKNSNAEKKHANGFPMRVDITWKTEKGKGNEYSRMYEKEKGKEFTFGEYYIKNIEDSLDEGGRNSTATEDRKPDRNFPCKPVTSARKKSGGPPVPTPSE